MFMEKVRDKAQEPDGKFTKQIGTTVYTVNIFLSKDTMDTYADRMMRLLDRELYKVNPHVSLLTPPYMKVGLLCSLRRMHTSCKSSLALYGLHSECAVLSEVFR